MKKAQKYISFLTLTLSATVCFTGCSKIMSGLVNEMLGEEAAEIFQEEYDRQMEENRAAVDDLLNELKDGRDDRNDDSKESEKTDKAETEKAEKPDHDPDYVKKVQSFISDPVYQNGADWGQKSDGPNYSGWHCTSCCAYTADFVKIVFNVDSPRGGTPFYNASEIRDGDVIYIKGNEAEGTQDHWFVVLYRDGNALTTAEGSWFGGKVVVSSSAYTIVDGTIYRDGAKFRTFGTGYHFQ